MKEKRGISNPPAPSNNLSGYSYGGVGFASQKTAAAGGDTSAANGAAGTTSNNLSSIIKNKEIFERAQKRE